MHMDIYVQIFNMFFDIDSCINRNSMKAYITDRIYAKFKDGLDSNDESWKLWKSHGTFERESHTKINIFPMAVPRA